MQCVEFERELQDWFDGDIANHCGAGQLPQSLSRHAKACADCKTLVADYRMLFAALGQLYPQEAPAPVTTRSESPLSRPSRQFAPPTAMWVAAAAVLLMMCGWLWLPATSNQRKSTLITVATNDGNLDGIESAPIAAQSVPFSFNSRSAMLTSAGRLGKLTLVPATVAAASDWLQTRSAPWEQILQAAGSAASRTDLLLAGRGSSVLDPTEAVEFGLADYSLDMFDWEQPSLGMVLNLAGWQSVALSTEVLDPQQLFEQPKWIQQVAEGIGPMTSTMTGTITALLRALPSSAASPDTEDRGARHLPLDVRFDRAIALG
jgi:hypothetical protein